MSPVQLLPLSSVQTVPSRPKEYGIDGPTKQTTRRCVPTSAVLSVEIKNVGQRACARSDPVNHDHDRLQTPRIEAARACD